MFLTPIIPADAIDYDELDAARQEARSLARHEAYLAEQRRLDALPAWYAAGHAPVGPDEPHGPTGYAWMRERGE